jgi:octaprenyl-diphosphate synthase
MTLPLIYSLNKASTSEKRKVINIVKNHNTDDKKVSEVINFVKETGGLEYATERMNEYRTKAFTMLEPLPESTYKKSLKDLVLFTTERNN